MTEITLTGTTVELRPLQREHSAALVQAAADGQLWNLKVTNVPGPDTVEKYVDIALAGREAGTMIPFVIVRHDTGEIVVVVSNDGVINAIELGIQDANRIVDLVKNGFRA